jgi:methyl-accepting chemotaxis protein
MRYMQPVRLTRDCLLCHGDPAGTKDPFGYTKEGMKEGDLRGGFEVKAPADELVANASSNSRVLFLTSLFMLLAAAGAVALVVRGTVIKPVGGIRALLVALAGGDLTQRVEVHSEDEVGQMAETVNATVKSMDAALRKIDHESTQLAQSSEKMAEVSQNIRANSEETSAQANAFSAATEEVNRNLQTVATATEEMSASIQEIAKIATEAAKIAAQVMTSAAEADRTVSILGASSVEIGQVIKMITSIAQKTDLLALNATVEAARAGEVGAASRW